MSWCINMNELLEAPDEKSIEHIATSIKQLLFDNSGLGLEKTATEAIRESLRKLTLTGTSDNPFATLSNCFMQIEKEGAKYNGLSTDDFFSTSNFHKCFGCQLHKEMLERLVFRKDIKLPYALFYLYSLLAPICVQCPINPALGLPHQTKDSSSFQTRVKLQLVLN